MPRTIQEIEQRLRERLAPDRLEVIDESAAHAGHVGANEQGYGSHVRVRISAAAMAGRTRIQRHRLVYDALHDFMAEGLHALAIETFD